MPVLSYPQSVAEGDVLHPGYVAFTIFKRKSPKESAPHSTVNLYLPEEMRNPSTARWESKNVGIAGAWLQDRIGFGEGAKQWLHKQGSNLVYGAAGYVAGQAGSNLTADDLRSLSTGEVRNPYLTSMFQGVDQRSFTMAFKFYPLSEKDCQTIFDIITTFRKAQVPPGKAVSQSAFLGYPDEIEVEYRWMGKRNKWLNRFRRSNLIEVETNYTGQGQWTVMRNGFPSTITMQLQFREQELVLRDDIDDGY